MKKIILSQGKVALVDDSDYPGLSGFIWCAVKDGNTFYAARTITYNNGVSSLLRMHSVLLLGVEKIDHRDGDGLNNQRHNLRPATTRQNGQNRRKVAAASSAFKGVSFHLRDRKWQARIKVSAARIQLGYFESEADAARAYNAAALKYFGEFASLNVIP